MIMGAIIGGATGICAASILFAATQQKKRTDSLTVDEIEDLIGQMGKVLRHHDLKAPASIIKETEKQVKKNEDKISGVLEMISAGLHIWEAFKKR